MNPLAQRLLTVLSGAAVITAGVLIPAAGAYLLPAGVGLLTWAIPHTADRPKPDTDKAA